jgi:beta-glucosidase
MVNSSQDFYPFPDGFLWGTATSSYQVEGGITNDWSTSGLDAGKACRHYEKFTDDFQTAKSLNNNIHRFSLEWARIEPEEGKWDYREVEHYRDVLFSLKANGLKPMVTLHHFTNPVWVAEKGGWENPEIVTWFTRYTRFIVNELHGEAELWLTINEPNVYAFKAFDEGAWPPFKKNRKSALKVMANLLKAHAAAYRAIHEISADLKVSFAHHIAILQPNNRFNPVDNFLAWLFNKIFNLSFWQSVLTGVLNFNLPGITGAKEPYNKELHNSLDFIAFNYYTRYLVNTRGRQITGKGAETTDIGWDIYPEGLLAALKIAGYFAHRLNIPIYITENGIDDGSDRKRAKFILAHLMQVWQAIQEGIPVKGYLYWSLIDNFEWADKYGPKFGLMSIDRQLRPSAEIYKEICAKNGISGEMSSILRFNH